MTTTIYNKAETDNLIANSDALSTQYNTDLNAKIAALNAKIDAIIAPTPTPTNIYDDLKYAFQFGNGTLSPNAKWICDFTSNGFAKVENGSIVGQPGGTEVNQNSGSWQVRSTKQWKNSRITFDCVSEAQVFSVKAPYHATWGLIRHIDKRKHWYWYLGLNHVEIGRKDVPSSVTSQTEIERGQMIIWTGGPGTAINQKRKVKIEFIDNVLQLWLDGQFIVKLVDDGRLTSHRGEVLPRATFDTGAFSLYAEGSRSRYWPAQIETL